MNETNRDRDKTYIYLLNEFGEEKLENRFLFLYSIAKKYLKERRIEEITAISIDTLINIVIDYFTDVSRLKKFHEIDKINELKENISDAYKLMMEDMKDDLLPGLKGDIKQITLEL